MPQPETFLIIHNVRSCHNVGSLFRTADGLGINKIFITGHTPYPKAPNDTRLPHVIARAEKQIHKTALGAEVYVNWQQNDQLGTVVSDLKAAGCQILALEQAAGSVDLREFDRQGPVALIVGHEVDGLDPESLQLASKILEIPMRGQKESLNVSVAAAIALHHLIYQA